MHLKAAFARVYATDPRPKNVSAFERSVCGKSHDVLARPPPRMVGHLGGKGQAGRDRWDGTWWTLAMQRLSEGSAFWLWFQQAPLDTHLRDQM